MISAVRLRTSSRNSYRKVTTLAFVAFCAVLLSACRVDSVVTLDVKENGSGTLSVVTTADADLISRAPGLVEDLSFDDAKSAGWKVTEPSITTDGGMQMTVSHSFNNPQEASLLLAQLSGANGPFKEMSLTRSGKDTDSTWMLNGRLEVNGGLEAFADPKLLKTIGGSPFAGTLASSELDIGQVIGIEFRAFLPGRIESTTGVNTFGYPQWTVSFDGSEQSIATVAQNTAVNSTVARITTPILFGLLVIWVVGVGGFAAFVAFTRFKRSRRTPTK